MNDQSVELLVQQLSRIQGKCLIVADENWAATSWHSVAHSGIASRTLFSNRYEIAQSAEQAGIETVFNDFDFSALAAGSFDSILFRVSKERNTARVLARTRTIRVLGKAFFGCRVHASSPS